MQAHANPCKPAAHLEPCHVSEAAAGQMQLGQGGAPAVCRLTQHAPASTTIRMVASLSPSIRYFGNLRFAMAHGEGDDTLTN